MVEHNWCAQVGQLAGCTHEGRAAGRIQRREAVTDDAGPRASALGTAAFHGTSEHGTENLHNVLLGKITLFSASLAAF